ncbi:DotG/IcmE/VirB10 family protein [Acidithiobacillus sp. 'AMD consortium']|uniref:DotG/IcmE/VirB10 family protein n=1 Tax=Acidithiobacillus sp. 'AMD consortium' TaxID=2614801 RepID=UPI00178C5194|nr:DotG/IcmE/VirB10 family protein [Acidithiobacillus sp. 'AMD consortium']
MGDPARRPLIVGGAALGVGVIGFLTILLWPRAPAVPISAGGQVAQMRNTPGGPGTPVYNADLNQYNQKQAVKALQAGLSSLPTVGAIRKATTGQSGAARPIGPVIHHRPVDSLGMTAVRYAPNPDAHQINAEVAAILKLEQPPVAVLVANGTLQGTKAGKVTAVTASTGGIAAPTLVNAGHISFAVLDTSIKSTEPGPVLATIETGRFAGARLLGGFTRVHDRVLVQFSSLTLHHQTISIRAYAITLATARTALATSVNRHTLYRYGWLIGASLLQGLNNALDSANTNTYLTGSGLGVVTHQLSNGQIALSAVGNVGQTLAPIMAQRFNTPPTVRVKAGSGIGILFMAPVKAGLG